MNEERFFKFLNENDIFNIVEVDGKPAAFLIAMCENNISKKSCPAPYGKSQKVAFGASFPGDEDLAHQANEYASVSGLMKSARIYANALLRLCAAE